jgi:NAD(P)-dependent dehydrogenase (short-subunit alcohol dehydrogenase family)
MDKIDTLVVLVTGALTGIGRAAAVALSASPVKPCRGVAAQRVSLDFLSTERPAQWRGRGAGCAPMASSDPLSERELRS